jgi:hypothetical protein
MIVKTGVHLDATGTHVLGAHLYPIDFAANRKEPFATLEIHAGEMEVVLFLRPQHMAAFADTFEKIAEGLRLAVPTSPEVVDLMAPVSG